MKVAFSITCHESYDCVIDQLRNFNFFSRSSVFILHVNLKNSDLFEMLSNTQFSDFGLRDDSVFINENRHDTSKSSYNLHKAHRDNFFFLKEKGVIFDYFVIEASNSLFIKPGFEDFIAKFDAGVGAGKISQYWKERMLNHSSLVSFFERYNTSKESFEQLPLKGCHEGAFFNAPIASEVFSLIDELDENCSRNNDCPNYPTEEIWFQVCLHILKKKNADLKAGGTLTYMPWKRNLEWQIKDVEDALVGIDFPEGKYLIKRIERQIDDRVRSFIRTTFGNYDEKTDR